jgi:hypothetical protein
LVVEAAAQDMGAAVAALAGLAHREPQEALAALRKVSITVQPAPLMRQTTLVVEVVHLTQTAQMAAEVLNGAEAAVLGVLQTQLAHVVVVALFMALEAVAVEVLAPQLLVFQRTSVLPLAGHLIVIRLAEVVVLAVLVPQGLMEKPLLLVADLAEAVVVTAQQALVVLVVLVAFLVAEVVAVAMYLTLAHLALAVMVPLAV